MNRSFVIEEKVDKYVPDISNKTCITHTYENTKVYLQIPQRIKHLGWLTAPLIIFRVFKKIRRPCFVNACQVIAVAIN